jgi:hypothetical protein
MAAKAGSNAGSSMRPHSSSTTSRRASWLSARRWNTASGSRPSAAQNAWKASITLVVRTPPKSTSKPR